MCRETGKYMLWNCPCDLVTQTFIKIDTMIFCDGFRGHRKLQSLSYKHKWVNYTVEYVRSDNLNIHTNQIEGLWETVQSRASAFTFS